MLNTRKMPAVPTAVLMPGARPAAIRGAVRADAGNIEKLLADVKAEVGRVGDQIKRTAEDALRQSRDAGTVSAEVKAAADQLLVEQQKLTAAQARLEGRLEELSTRNLDLEQRLAGRVGGGQAGRTVGQLVAEDERIKGFAAGGARGTVRIPVQNAITSLSGSAGALIWSDREQAIVGLPRRQLRIRDLLMPGSTTSNLVEYARQTTRTNNAAAVSEGGEKPQSNYVWDRDEAAVRTIAHWIHVSRQALDDAAQLQGEIDGELRYGLDLEEERQLLDGDGTGASPPELDGLLGNATAYVAEFAPTQETPIDTLRLAILQASLAEYSADGIVLHPIEWARIELTKTGDYAYLLANPTGMLGPTLWGRPVIPTQSMTEGDFLVGAFRMAATIYDRMGIEVEISSEDRDNFIKNMLTVRAEKRLALAVKRPAALVTGTFPLST
jgi:HK97 family phage major capsid protein